MQPTEVLPIPDKHIKAAVIDDAFDEIQPDEINIGDLRAAIQTIEADSELMLLFEKFIHDKPDLDSVEDDNVDYLIWLNRLWEYTNKEDSLANFLTNGIFNTRHEKREKLEKVCSNIENCGVIVSQYGEVNIEDHLEEIEMQGYQLVFVDYYLSPQDDQAGSQRAIDVARLINNRLEADRPITVLMSSHPNAEKQQAKFREEADLTQVTFQFISKDVLGNNVVASLVLKSVVSSLKYTSKIHKYILSLEKAAELALGKFKEEIKSLSIDDYAFVQYAKLNKDKHPLGDYMNWLYESRWGSLLLGDKQFQAQQKVLDSLTMSPGLLIRNQPSEHIARMYASGLFDEHVEKLDKHPHYDDENKLYLHTGDIFSKDSENKIYLLINPQCDLERDVHDDRSVLLLPGKLFKLNHPSKEISTDFFQLTDNTYKVSWILKEVVTVRYVEFKTWIESNELSRNHRLKLPFALQIQQEFSASMTRVGTPVTPPLIQQVNVSLWVKDLEGNGNNIKLTHEGLAGVTSIVKAGSQENPALILADKVAIEIKLAVVSYISKVTYLKTKKYSDLTLQKNISRVEDFLQNFDTWFIDNHPLSYRKDSTNTINVTLDKGALETCTMDTMLTLNITTN